MLGARWHTGQLCEERIGAIDFPQGFEDRAAVHRDGAGLIVGIGEIHRDALTIGVEDDPHEFSVAIYHRAAGVSAGDVGSRNKVERRVEPKLGPGALPAWR